jgi:hypothetical protein
MTASGNTYDGNERFIERFDLDLVILPARDRLPSWMALHLDMLVSTIIAHFNQQFVQFELCSTAPTMV